MSESEYQTVTGLTIEDPELADMMRKMLDWNICNNLAYTWDDIGTATLIAQLYRDSIRYCPQYGTWYIWDGSRWESQIDSGIICDKVQTVLNMMLLYVTEAEAQTGMNLDKYSKYVRSIRKNSAMKAIMAVMETMCRISANEFDNDPYVLNTPLCAYDLRTMEVVEEREKRNLTQVTGCNLISPTTETCTRWYRFIDEIMCGNKEQARFLQRALGYSILGVNREECMFIALGSQTRNGKGTLFSSIQAALGKEYSQGSDPQLICEGRNGKTTDFNAPQPALRKLVNCRLVVMSEAQMGVRLDAASMKTMTGRDTLTTRGLFEGSFDFIPQFSLWLNTNYLPAITDDTVFKSDRIWVINFGNHFDEDKRDVDLKTLFCSPEARPTILQWLVDGLQDYLQQGLNPPECVREATADYRDRFDRIGNFLRETCTVDPTGENRVIRGDLYAMYRTWCANPDNRYSPIGSTTFYSEVTQRGLPMRRVGDAWYIYGIIPEQKKEGVIKLL